MFVFQWFLANLSYQEALSDTQVAIVNILSSTSGELVSLTQTLTVDNTLIRVSLKPLLTVHSGMCPRSSDYSLLCSASGLFTLILTAIFPSNSSDRFTLSKLLAVALRYVVNKTKGEHAKSHWCGMFCDMSVAISVSSLIL